jgi:transposase
MAGKKGQKKRVWSDNEKRSICAQARVAGVSVAQVARRYAMNTRRRAERNGIPS